MENPGADKIVWNGDKDMYNNGIKGKIKTGLKKFLIRGYIDTVLIFAAMFIMGGLLAASAYAQSDQSPGSFGQSDPFSPEISQDEMGINQAPMLTRLDTDRSGPQEIGTSINWIADARDPENDPLFYMFQLNGPSTGGVWQTVKDWSQANTWTWDTASLNAGSYQIRVRVRDQMHTGPADIPDERVSTYQLTMQQAPVETQPAPAETPSATSSVGQNFIPQEAPLGQPVPEVPQQVPETIPETIPGSIASQIPEGIVSQAVSPVETETANQVPTIKSLTSVPSTPQESGVIVAWSAEASDLEGDIIQFRFFVDDLPVTDWQLSNQWTMDTSAYTIGTHSVEVKVREDINNLEGDNSKKSSFVITKPNELPVITEFASDKASPQESGTIVTWTARAADADNDQVLFRFFLNGLPVTDWTPNNRWAWTATEGEAQVEVQVRDGKHAGAEGFDDSRSETFVINAPNQKPAIVNFSSDKLSPQEIGSPIVWTVDVSDVENDPILYKFFLNGQPVSEWQSLGQWVWETTQADLGDNEVEVRIIDGKHAGQEGFDDRKSSKFTIIAPKVEEVAPKTEEEPAALQVAPEIIVPARLNESPSIISLTADKASPQIVGTVITWTTNANDPESDPINYRFLVNDTPETDWQSENQWSWTAMNPGASQIAVQVMDDQHAGPEGVNGNKSAVFTINAPIHEEVLPRIIPETETVPESIPEVVPARLNESPSIISLTADKASPQIVGTVITWTANANDPESDPISYRFLLNDTPETNWQSENQWSWTAMNPGASQITVQVMDDQHAGPEGVNGNKSAVFTINAPAPEEVLPRIIPEAKPDEETQAPNLTVPATVTNLTIPAENATEPEVIAPENAPESVIPPAAENITTPVGPENATNVEVPANETQIAAAVPVAENQTPILNSLSPNVISPQIPGVTVIWTANATDADQDPLLFRFFLTGPATNGAWEPKTGWSASNTWTWTTSSIDSGENQIRAQVRDGKHASEDGFDSELSGYFTLSEPSRNVSGRVFDDKNGNGRLENGEPLAGWTIQLIKPDNSQIATITKDDGSYIFEQLKPESYTISEALPSGWRSINPESGSYTVNLIEGDAANRDFANRLTSFGIAGMKFNDLNGNGVNDGEPGMEGWTIQLSQNGRVVNTTVTGRDGTYRFENLVLGSYLISEVEKSGWIRTSPGEGSHSVELKDSDLTGMDFGNHGSWAISGTGFSDANGNGARDGDEVGQAGWTIQLSQNGNIINATTTGQDGSYSFKNLAPGKYSVSEIVMEGWTRTLPKAESYDVELKDSDVSGMDFGNKGGLTISGVKFYDANENGVQDSDEPSIPGQPVTLVLNGNLIANVTSGEDGSYTFSNLVPGTYEVDDPITVSVSVTSVVVAPIPIIGTSSISGVKFNDLNGNGVKDSGEPGIANWDMALTFVGHAGHPVRDIIIAKTKTDANGAYSFRRLFPGIYKVSEFSQLGWTPTTAPELTVTLPGSKSNQNFGNRLVTQPNKASVWGVKFNDINGNGINNGEPGLSGWTIKLKNITTDVELTTTTNANGWYSFTNLNPGSYQVSEVVQSGWTPIAPAGGIHAPFDLVANDNKEKSFANRNNNLPPTILTLTSDPSSPRTAGRSIEFRATATDPENDPLQYRFVVKGPAPSNQVRDDTGYTGRDSWTWSTIGYVPGDYQVEVWVRDGRHSDQNGFDAKKSIAYKLTSANRPPRVEALFSDRPIPQYVGSWIRWTAIASDPEGDPLQYKFYLRGPSTNGFWIDQTGWGRNNRWTWRTNPLDIGNSEVLVAVRDGKHAGPGGSDDYEIARYIIIGLNEPPIITDFGTRVGSPQPIGATVGGLPGPLIVRETFCSSGTG